MTFANTSLPRAAQPFVEFSQILRSHGFAVSPEQTTNFIEGTGLLGPRSLDDIYRAGLALLAIPVERHGEYQALFRSFFMGQTVSVPTQIDDEKDDVEAFEDRGGEEEVGVEDEDGEVGAEATTKELLSTRTVLPADDDAILKNFSRHAPAHLPRRRSPRRRPNRHGDRFDLRRSLRDAVRRDGEIFNLRRTRRKTRQRNVILIIDVSGSMKDQTEGMLRFAHTLMQASDRGEVFTIGTRLTRVTKPLKNRNAARALEQASRLIADFDGGTRIGDALDALLSVPRFAGTLRGAAVVVISDGLERGEPDMLVSAVSRMSRLAWRLDWLSPLALGDDFVPATAALQAVQPWLSSLSDGSSLEAITDHVLSIAKEPMRRAA